MRVVAQICVKNEASRYWASWIDWHRTIFDVVHVYDDDSTDATPDMAEQAGFMVSRRYGAGVSFLEHEGKFRQQAWNALEAKAAPERDDWIVAIDADEFLVARQDERDTLYRMMSWAEQARRNAYVVSIPEVFAVDVREDGGLANPCVRIDGWWGKIAGTRMFRYFPGGVFADKPMGSGSEPIYVAASPRTVASDLYIMHYGYARPEDQQAKYARYTSLAVHGHNNAHIESIITKPELMRWDGPMIDVYFGERPGSVSPEAVGPPAAEGPTGIIPDVTRTPVVMIEESPTVSEVVVESEGTSLG